MGSAFLYSDVTLILCVLRKKIRKLELHRWLFMNIRDTRSYKVVVSTFWFG